MFLHLLGTCWPEKSIIDIKKWGLHLWILDSRRVFSSDPQHRSDSQAHLKSRFWRHFENGERCYNLRLTDGYHPRSCRMAEGVGRGPQCIARSCRMAEGLGRGPQNSYRSHRPEHLDRSKTDSTSALYKNLLLLQTFLGKLHPLSSDTAPLLKQGFHRRPRNVSFAVSTCAWRYVAWSEARMEGLSLQVIRVPFGHTANPTFSPVQVSSSLIVRHQDSASFMSGFSNAGHKVLFTATPCWYSTGYQLGTTWPRESAQRGTSRRPRALRTAGMMAEVVRKQSKARRAAQLQQHGTQDSAVGAESGTRLKTPHRPPTMLLVSKGAVLCAHCPPAARRIGVP